MLCGILFLIFVSPGAPSCPIYLLKLGVVVRVVFVADLLVRPVEVLHVTLIPRS